MKTIQLPLPAETVGLMLTRGELECHVEGCSRPAKFVFSPTPTQIAGCCSDHRTAPRPEGPVTLGGVTLEVAEAGESGAPADPVEVARVKRSEAWQRYQGAREGRAPMSELEALLRDAVTAQNEYEELLIGRRTSA